MVAQGIGAAAEVVSLSSGQVNTLLRTLNEHRELLDVAHEDARRLALAGRRPAYLVDFELIYRYMFRGAERPDWEQELRYLFDLPDTRFLIGPGTSLEIERLVHNAGFVEDADGNLQDLLTLIAHRRRLFGLDEDAISHGMTLLASLLASPNFSRYEDVVTPATVDAEALETAKAALDKRRPNASESANLADAINWSAVIYLRRRADELALDFHPYLLTATRPLLDEAAWSSEITAPVSRRPAEAIYTEVLLEVFPDPIESQNHTVEMAFEAARLVHVLRRSPAYRNPRRFQHEPKWERVVERDLVPDDLRVQLSQLNEFVTDPVVIEAQRVYDISHVAAISARQQRGSARWASSESPQRLFDLIVGVNSVLHAPRRGPGLAGLWSAALAVDVESRPGRVTHRLVDTSSRRRTYLTIEEYHTTAGSDAQYALRWPSSINARDVVRLFSRAFERHKTKVVDLVVGTHEGTRHLGADVPFTLKQIVDAVNDYENPGVGEVLWIRIGADDFDLYADLLPPAPREDPVIGLFVEHIDPTHIADLYMRTSAGYVFPAWLRAALSTIAASASVEASAEEKA